MDFSKINIEKILRYSLEERFQDISPQDFEDFITQLYKDNDYKTKQTKYSGDYGVDLIIQKDGISTAVQIKRYAKNNKVGVKDINQVIGGKDFWDCEKAMVITTSSFTEPAKKLATKTKIKLYDWNKLQKLISKTYLDYESYQTYYKPKKERKKNIFHCEIYKVNYNIQMKGGFIGTIIYTKITNQSERNYNVSVDLPTYISEGNDQSDSNYYFQNYFNEGMIYAQCSVETAFIFLSSQVPKVKVGDKMILTLNYSGTKSRKIINVEKNYYGGQTGCFIATAAYGTPYVYEIQILRYWRDEILSKKYMGKLFIKLYYMISPFIAKRIRKKEFLKKITRQLLMPLIKLIKKKIKLTL